MAYAIEAASHSANEIDSNGYAWALRDVACTLARAQRWGQAERIVYAISVKEHHRKAEALYELANALAEAEQWEQMKCIWSEAKKMARIIKVNQWPGVRPLMSLACILARKQRWEQAEEIVHALKNEAKIEALCNLATIMEVVHQQTQAERLWTEAIALVRSVTFYQSYRESTSGGKLKGLALP